MMDFTNFISWGILSVRSPILGDELKTDLLVLNFSEKQAKNILMRPKNKGYIL